MPNSAIPSVTFPNPVTPGMRRTNSYTLILAANAKRHHLAVSHAADGPHLSSNGLRRRSMSVQALDQYMAIKAITIEPSSPTSVVDRVEFSDSDSDINDDVIMDAVKILRSNDYGGYTIPTRGLYPYQWNWDSALVAIGWSAVDETRAWLELQTLMSAQWDDGMVPHIVFHQDSTTYFPGPEIWGAKVAPIASTGITQPPVVAIAVKRLLEVSGNESMATEKAEELFPKLMAYHRWFYSARDPQGTGLVATLHPWESGMDNSSAWDSPLANVPVDNIPAYTRRDLGHVDAAMRPQQAEYDRYLTLLYRFKALDYNPDLLFEASPFRVTDLCTNSVLHRANLDLRWIAVHLGKPQAIVDEIDSWISKGEMAFGRLWDEKSKIFRSRDQLIDEPLDAATSAGFLPLFARVATPEQAAELVTTLGSWLDAVEFGVPSLDPRDPKFEPLRYWRGPVWIIVNYMITDGLRHYGYSEMADRIEYQSRRLLNTRGLFEYYDPTNGDGAGGSSFSWTAAMCLAWLDQPSSK